MTIVSPSKLSSFVSIFSNDVHFSPLIEIEPLLINSLASLLLDAAFELTKASINKTFSSISIVLASLKASLFLCWLNL